jgi:hypothetical protein
MLSKSFALVNVAIRSFSQSYRSASWDSMSGSTGTIQINSTAYSLLKMAQLDSTCPNL